MEAENPPVLSSLHEVTAPLVKEGTFVSRSPATCEWCCTSIVRMWFYFRFYTAAGRGTSTGFKQHAGSPVSWFNDLVQWCFMTSGILPVFQLSLWDERIKRKKWRPNPGHITGLCLFCFCELWRCRGTKVPRPVTRSFWPHSLWCLLTCRRLFTTCWNGLILLIIKTCSIILDIFQVLSTIGISEII